MFNDTHPSDSQPPSSTAKSCHISYRIGVSFLQVLQRLDIMSVNYVLYVALKEKKSNGLKSGLLDGHAR